MMDLRKIKLTAYYVPPSLPIPRKLENLQAEVRENGIRIVRSRTFKVIAQGGGQGLPLN